MKSFFTLISFLLLSTFIFPQTPDCNTIAVNPGAGSISVSGVNAAPIVGVQVFNSSWASVFSQTYTTHGDVINVSPITAGQYFVNVRFYNSSWASICEKGSNVTVSDTPPQDTCTHTFQKSYGSGAADERAIDLVKSQDGGYVAAGLASASGNTNHDALLMKFDKNGNVVWSKTYGGTQEDYFFNLIATSDGGYLAGGSLNSSGFDTYSGDPWLVKTDGNGTIQWQKKYSDNTNPGRINAVTETSDGGYAFVMTYPFMPGAADWTIVKTDAIGNFQWQKKLGTSSSDDGIGIVEDNHGGNGLVVTGYNYSSTNYDGDIVKFDLSTGNVLWTKTYDLDGRTNRFNSIFKVSDGFVISAVTHDGFENANASKVIIKTDFNGNIILVKEFRVPGTGVQDGHVTPLPDGYMIAIDELPEATTSDIHLLRTDAAGNLMWSKKYPLPDAQVINKVLLDGNFVVGVGTTKAGSYEDVFLIKSDLNGKMGGCSSTAETSTSRTPVVSTLSSPFTINSNSSLLITNTSSTATSVSPASSIFCIDSCSAPPPTLSISNVTVNENVGNAVLQACLSAPAPDSMMFVYSTANGTAVSGSDFTGGSGHIVFGPGQTCVPISIPIINDAIAESTESFTVTSGTATGTVTINDDDQTQYDCNNVTITPGNNLMTIAGLTAPVVTVQVFNSNWASVFNQSYNAPGTVNVPIPAGSYHVKVTFYTNNWSLICDKNQDVTVVNQCPAGTICISNLCPSQEVDLNAAYSISNLPSGTVVTWHTATPATDANRLTAAQAQHVTTSGTYYAAINISGGNCYSNTIPVNVTIIQCSGSSPITGLELKSAGEMPSGKAMVYPNPFTHSVSIVIQSEKIQKATLVLTDMMGRQLKSRPVQLVRGGNHFTFDGLDQFPSGNYFLKVTSQQGMQTFKLLRQQ